MRLLERCIASTEAMQKEIESEVFRHIQKHEQYYSDDLMSEQEWDSWKHALADAEINEKDAEFWRF